MAIETVLVLPDLLSQCSFKWSKNSHYETAGPNSAAWLDDYFDGDKLEHFKKAQADLLVAYTYPYVNPESFRMCADNMNLLFVVDAISDEQDGVGAALTRGALLTSLRGEPCDGTVISRMAKDFMDRFIGRFTHTFLQRYLQHTQDYIDAVVQEARFRERGEVMKVGEYRSLRRNNGGVIVAFDLIELALGIELPAEVLGDPNFQQIYNAALDMVDFSNDVLSYKMESAQGLSGCNLVTVIMHNDGLTLQEAVDHIGLMFQKLMRQMLQGKSSLRSFGPTIDAQLRLYIKGLEDWVVGNLKWSFESKRYFGDKADQVKLTREIIISDL